MSANYCTIPTAAIKQPKPFVVRHTDEQLRDFKTAIESAKLGPTTYENLQQDRKYGVTSQWLREAVEAWKEFDW